MHDQSWIDGVALSVSPEADLLQPTALEAVEEPLPVDPSSGASVAKLLVDQLPL